MTLLAKMRKSFRSRKPSSKPTNRRFSSLEPLEDRRMLANIVWDNRAVSDDFDNYGGSEAVARQIVDRAIDDWEEVISDFNYANGTNTFHVNFNAYSNDGVCGSSDITSVDALGKPTHADIELCGGTSQWYFDPLIGTNFLPDDSEFTEFITPFASGRDSNDGDIDFYTVVLHELGHALGIASGNGLKINDYLSGPLMDDPVNPSMPGDPGNHLYALNIGGGPIEATFTDAGSGDPDNLFPAHLYEGPSTAETNNLGLPTHPDNLLNDGRTWNNDREVRRLIPDFTVGLLEMVYDYDVIMPSNLNTFYANLNVATGELYVQGEEGNFDDEIEMDEVANDVRAQVNGTSERIPNAAIATMEVRSQSGEDFIEINATPIGKPIEVFGGNDDDVIVVANDGNITFIDGDVTIHGSLGNDILNIQDLGNASDRTYFISDSSITPSGLGWSIDYSPSVETIFLNGTQGDNAFFIESVQFDKTMIVNGQGGDDSFFAGGMGIIPTLNGIQGSLSMSGGPGTDLVRFNDNANIGNETYTLTDLSLRRTDIPGPMAYTTMEAVEINAGQGNDQILLNSLDDPTTVHGGAGSDTFVVGDGDIDSNITDDLDILGGSALGPNDHVVLEDSDDTNNDTYWLESDSFNKFNFPPTLTYDSSIDLVTLNANDQDNIINVDSVGDDVLININGRAGDDSIRVGDGDIDSHIDGNVVVDGGTGDNELRFQDGNDQAGNDSYAISSDSFTKSVFTGSVDFQAIDLVWLMANDFDNTIDVHSTPENAVVRIDGSDGEDHVHVTAPPTSPITFNGELPNVDPGDSLSVTGAQASVGTYRPDAATTGDGVVTVDGVDITFTGLEPVTVDNFAEFSIVTPNGADDLVIDEFGANQNVITGTSGGVTFEELRFSDVGTFVVDMASNDAPLAHDDLRLVAGNMPATGVDLVEVHAGIGTNTLWALSGTTNVNTSVGPQFGRELDVIVRFDNTRLNFLESQQLQSLSVISGLVSLEPNGANTILATESLDVSGGPGLTATLDLNDNGLIVDYVDGGTSPYGALRDQIIHARNENAPVRWTGSGITSSVAAFDPTHKAVGYAEASELFNGGGGTFLGQPIAAGNEAVLIRATQLGDATLDGITDGIDFIQWNANKFGPGDWTQGDFNYDGIVDGLDYIEWNNNKFMQFDEMAPVVQPNSGSATGDSLHATDERIASYSNRRVAAELTERELVDQAWADFA